MNPGGIVSEEHYDVGSTGGVAVVNGHSYADESRHSDNTNFAMLVSTSFTEPFNQPIEYGPLYCAAGKYAHWRRYNGAKAGRSSAGQADGCDPIEKIHYSSYTEKRCSGDLSFVLPHRHLTSIVEALKAFDKLAPGLYSKNTLLYGVEVKFYSSKISVENNFETAVKNLYAIGDGAGITRGLMQASVTGVVVARDMAKKMHTA